MNTEIIDISDQRWLKTLQIIPHDIYHLPTYFSLEAKRSNAVPQACLISEAEKIFFVPYLLRKCDDSITKYSGLTEVFDITSPYGYPGILINHAAAQSPEFLERATYVFQQELKQQNICSAFIRLHPIINEHFHQLFPDDILTFNGQTVSMDLKLSESQLWAHTRKGHQSTINKCKRLGFIGRTVKFSEYYNEFIEIYEETMNRVKASGSYYFDHDYFSALNQLDEKLHLCVIELEQKIICASLFFESCGIVQAHLGGTKNEFLSQSPFNLLLHHARLYFKERGNQYLHIGGGIGGSTNDSLFTFKSGFSRQKHDFFTLRLIVDPEKYLHLVNSKAKILNTQIEVLTNSGFFPAYRANIPA